MNFETQHDVYYGACEAEIKRNIASFFQPDSVVSKAAEYGLLNGGKRVRGVLVQAVCALLGGTQYPAVSFSSSIEMIHAFSLIHDDLPCMDDDSLRRGKPSCHVAFGEANALLAGDLLSLAAFSVLACAPEADSEMVKQAVVILSQSSGAKGMIYGQELDMQAEEKRVDYQEIIEVHRHKTGDLICAAAKLGIVAAKQPIEQHSTIISYAETLGFVFQIVDDILDVIGNENMLGKPIGSDDRNNKSTFVSIKGLEESMNIAKEKTNGAVKELEKVYGESAWFLCDFAMHLVKRLS